jgi:hypothetical protein
MSLTAIYYPYSRALMASTLRKAALLFDTLYFLDSESWFVRTVITRDKLISRSGATEVDQIERDYHLLRAEGFVGVLDAASIARDHDELLTANVMKDIGDDEFCKLAVGYNTDVWSILRERIPPSLFEWLYQGAGTFSEAISLQALINAGGDSGLIENEEVRRFAEFRWQGEEEREKLSVEAAMQLLLGKRFFRDDYRYVIGGNPHIELPAYDFPFLQASSLRINECLIAAALNGYTPYTDSTVHDALLRLKVNRVLAEVDMQPELKRHLSIDLPLRFPRQSLALEVLDYVIPDEALNRISVSDLLLYRSRNQKLLSRFHSYLEVLAADIGDVLAGDEYVKSVRRIVSSKVLPELTKARDDLLTSYEDAFGGIVASSGVAVASTISATVFSGLDLWQVLLAGALAEGSVLATKAPTALLKAWKGRRASGRSPMAYIVGIGEARS